MSFQIVAQSELVARAHSSGMDSMGSGRHAVHASARGGFVLPLIVRKEEADNRGTLAPVHLCTSLQGKTRLHCEDAPAGVVRDIVFVTRQLVMRSSPALDAGKANWISVPQTRPAMLLRIVQEPKIVFAPLHLCDYYY